VAIKKIDVNEANQEILAREIHVLRSSDHPNIVQYYGTYVFQTRIWVFFFYVCVDLSCFVLSTI